MLGLDAQNHFNARLRRSNVVPGRSVNQPMQPAPNDDPRPPTGGLDPGGKGFGGNVSPGKDVNGGLLQPLPQLPPTKYDNPNPHQTPPWNPNPNPGPGTWATDGPTTKGWQIPYDTRKDPVPPTGGLDNWGKGFGGNVSPGKDGNGGLLQPLPQLPPTKYDNPNPSQTPPWNPNPNPGPGTWGTDGIIPVSQQQFGGIYTDPTTWQRQQNAPPGTGGYNMQGPPEGYQMPYDTRKDPRNPPPPPEGGNYHPLPLGIPAGFSNSRTFPRQGPSRFQNYQPQPRTPMGREFDQYAQRPNTEQRSDTGTTIPRWNGWYK